jgi:hypothetical protein
MITAGRAVTDGADEMRRLYRLSLFSIIALGTLVSLAWAWAALTPVPLSVPKMVIGTVEMGHTVLCPGDMLTYTYTVDILEPGVYIFDFSVWRVDDPHVMEWSTPLRVVSQKSGVVEVTRNWTLPAGVYNQLENRTEPWKPGQYERHIGLTASGRDMQPSMVVIPFEIKGDCP